jgi:hypothetical protein
MTAKTSNTLRWIAVLPAAIGSYAGIILLTVFFVILYSDHTDTGHDAFGIELIVAIFAPIATIYAAATTAPRNKFAVAVSIAVLNALFVVAICICLFLGIIPSQSHWPVPFWKHVLAAICSIIPTIFACWEVSLGGTQIGDIEIPWFW